ncbi:PBECR2 nuclease fold domain-containing protein [Selenomonas dianae]|uniref:Phage-Barnase-EndoU-ColicinE5/D-RelE like nuclease 3 domain-containing protein n=1 Tax=Selenomonas dianae TaxID=135079 RepID=A0ABP3CNL8_9FIRM|nr:PBECR2 nuclease fold domain-containing protein [Selenomonas dianae]WLD82096.1 PBECR2 nuclease fold domain-containing protein [Selenomonas dianae]
MQPIAHITQEIIDLLGLPCQGNTPIYLGQTNRAHMQSRHPQDYQKYQEYIGLILTEPEYVGVNPSDQSIEYVRAFQIDAHEYVKVAVRVSLSGRYYARTLYVLNPNRVHNFIQRGTLKRLTV